jgi:chorismate synthase
MPGNSFGHTFRVTTAGVSHGPGYLCIVDGCPAGLPFGVEDLLPDLARRRPGQSKLTTQRDEADTPEIWSGVFEGKTDGTSIGILFRNGDQRSHDYGDIRDKYRPGHADYTFDAKYGFRDYRGGGRSSARETVCRVAAGAIAKKLLATVGVRIVGYVKSVGHIIANVPDPTAVTLELVEATPVRCPDPAAAAEMIALIDAIRMDRDSIGGTAEFVAIGVPAGWGEPVFDKLKADLGKAYLSLPAVTAFEYGSGFTAATLRGSQHNDRMTHGFATTTNRHGGMLGGISSGMPILCRTAIKPTSSIPRPQCTVTRSKADTIPASCRDSCRWAKR